jgi:phosphoribosyl-ATP pyrophosphohydrolase
MLTAKIMGYHRRKIPKGKLGEASKITEEYQEMLDGLEQGNKVLVICELADMLGAIEAYALKTFNLTLEDLHKMSKATARAFKKGDR